MFAIKKVKKTSTNFSPQLKFLLKSNYSFIVANISLTTTKKW